MVHLAHAGYLCLSRGLQTFGALLANVLVHLCRRKCGSFSKELKIRMETGWEHCLSVTWCYMVRKLRWFELPALLTDPQVLLFFLLSHCPSVRSCARQFEVVPVS